MAPAFAELVKAHKRGDRAALARVADRMGLVRLGEAIASAEPGVGEAALAALPLARGGVLLIGAATDQIGVSDWPRAAAAATALGGAARRRGADGARGVGGAARRGRARVHGAARARLAIGRGAGHAAGRAGCGRGGGAELRQRRGPGAARARRNAGAAARGDCWSRRSGNEREALLRDAIADADRTVSTAATAAACRIEARTGQGGKTEPPPAQALAAARTMAAAPTTPPEDAVEMLDCLAAAGTPQDRALLEELQRRPPSPLRDRAVELGVRPPPGKP